MLPDPGPGRRARDGILCVRPTIEDGWLSHGEDRLGRPDSGPSPTAGQDASGVLSLLHLLVFFEKSIVEFLPAPRTSKSTVFSPDWTVAKSRRRPSPGYFLAMLAVVCDHVIPGVRLDRVTSVGPDLRRPRGHDPSGVARVEQDRPALGDRLSLGRDDAGDGRLVQRGILVGLAVPAARGRWPRPAGRREKCLAPTHDLHRPIRMRIGVMMRRHSRREPSVGRQYWSEEITSPPALRAEGPPGVDADARLDELDRAVAEQDVDAAGMVAAGVVGDLEAGAAAPGVRRHDVGSIGCSPAGPSPRSIPRCCRR